MYYYNIDDQNHSRYQRRERLARNLRNSIVGAIYYHDQIHIITRKTILLFQSHTNYQQTNDRELNEEFPRLTGVVKKAFSYGHLHHFFTTDRLVYIWSEPLNTWQTYGMPMETNWLACTGTSIYSSTTIETNGSSDDSHYHGYHNFYTHDRRHRHRYRHGHRHRHRHRRHRHRGHHYRGHRHRGHRHRGHHDYNDSYDDDHRHHNY